MPSTNLSNWARFCLLNWKNFFVMWNNRRQLICVFLLMPFIVYLPMIVFCYSTHPEITAEKHYETIDMKAAWTKLCTSIDKSREAVKKDNPQFKSSVYVPNLVIGFSSAALPDVQNLLNKAISSLDPQPELRGYDECTQVMYMLNKEHYLAGVCFHNIYDIDDLGNNDESNTEILNFTIIFPPELRMADFGKDGMLQIWNTHILYENVKRTYELLNRRSGDYEDDNNYIREGFISLQDAISRAYLDTINSKNYKLPDVELRRFPYRSYLKGALNYQIYTTSCMASFGLLLPVIFFTYLITKEKEHYLKHFVKTLGVPDFVNFASWSLMGIFLFVCSSIVTLAALKMNWNNNSSIINQTDTICVLTLLLTYSMATTTFCVFVSSFFQQSHSSVAVIGILWITTFVPYWVQTDSEIYYYIFINTILGYAFEAIWYYEAFDDGLQWIEMFDENISVYNAVGKASCYLLVHAIAYLLLAVAIEFIIPLVLSKSRTWNCLFNTTGAQSITNLRRTSNVDQLYTQVMQVEPLYKRQLVSIENLNKIYGKREVVQNVTLNLYENDITVLLGHNGSGKTTLLSLLLGVVTPSEGRIRIEDRDVAEYKNIAYANIGGCLRDHLLFGDLNVENQIRFFSRLKGLSWKQANYEVEKYCRQMELTDKRKILTKHLTVGLRHQLAVCCAFTGESKIVILDEPNFGMDLSAAKLVLQLLTDEKRNRTILISTDSTEMADAIADRVSIMANGTIVCTGSIVFLRNIYNKGTRLLITKAEGCKSEKVTKCLQRFIPDIVIETQVVNIILYTIHETYSHLIGDILETLEKELLNLSIESYAVDDLTIRDIVLKMTSNVTSHGIDTKKTTFPLRGASMYSYADHSSTSLPEKDTNIKSEKLKALFFTRMIYYIRHKLLFLLQVLLPIFFTIFVFQLSSPIPDYTESFETLILSIDSYPNSRVIVGEVSGVNEYMHRIAYEYKEKVFWMNNLHHTEVVNGDRFEDIVIEIMERQPIIFETDYIVGVQVANEKIIAYYNNFPLHAAPISLNMAYNSIARNIRNKETKISVRMQNLNGGSQLSNIAFARSEHFENFVLLVLLSTMITLSNSVYDMTKSHSALFRHWLNIGGAVKIDFWFMSFCFDFIKTVIIATVIVLSALGCLVEQIVHTAALGYFFLCLLLGGVCINSMNYINVKLFKHAQPCLLTSLMNGIVGVILFIIGGIAYQEDYFNNSLHYYFLVHPYYALGTSLIRIMQIHNIKIQCNNNDFKKLLETFEDAEFQCKDNVSFFDQKFGVLPNVIALVGVTILAWILVFILENLAYFRKFWIFKVARDDSECAWADHVMRHSPNAPSTVGEDNVTHEQIVVDTLKPYEQKSITLIVDRVGKNFGVVGALHRISFVLDKCQICGILGLNGAGKSVLLKILANDMTQSYGEVCIFGVNVLENRKNAYRNIGYCPENLEVIFEYTPREILELFAVLNEISSKKLSTHCENLAHSLGFYDYYDQVLKICSDGIQKRVGTALALIGDRRIILLDDALSGVDAGGKLLIYNILSKACRSGSSVLFSSLSPDECQKICNKTIIMVDGRLINTGTLSDLYNRREYGYLLQVRMKPYHIFERRKSHGIHREDRFSLEYSHMRVIAFIQTSFQGASFRRVEGNLLSFVVPNEHNISRIYSTIRNNAFTYNIESFGLNRAPFQMVYLNIVNRCKMNLY